MSSLASSTPSLRNNELATPRADGNRRGARAGHILYALHSTLRAAERALLAAHPELEEVDLAADLVAVAPMACAADLLLTHIFGIDAAINRYVSQLRQWSVLRRSREDF